MSNKKEIMFLAFLGIIIMFSIIIALNMLPSVFFSFKEASAVGIIGGADGPTIIYVAASGNWQLILLFSLLLIAIDLIALATKKIIESKRKKTIDSKYFILFIFLFNSIVILLLFPGMIIQLSILNAIIALLYLSIVFFKKRT